MHVNIMTYAKPALTGLTENASKSLCQHHSVRYNDAGAIVFRKSCFCHLTKQGFDTTLLKVYSGGSDDMDTSVFPYLITSKHSDN